MATYTGIVTAKTAALAAATEDRVQFSRSVRMVAITNHSAADTIYYTVDATAAVSAGDNVRVLRPGVSRIVSDKVGPGTQERTITEVRLISAGTPTYTVEVEEPF